MEIFSIIYDWINIFEYNDKFIAVVNQIIFRNILFFGKLYTRNWNLITTSYQYHSMAQPGTSKRTDTTRSTIPDKFQIRNWPKTSPHDCPNTHTLHALYSIRTKIVHRFQNTLTVRNTYSHESYNAYQHIIDSEFPWSRTCWTCCTVVTWILLHFIFFTHVHKILPFYYFYDSRIAPHTHLS